jgi:predicted anti-sigma-YlaC factor YlaD
VLRAAFGLLLLSGCSATGILANALAGSGGVYATDDDPELIRDATPFALKTMEGVLVEQPEHQGLLLALASGFTQYGYAFVQQDADGMADQDIDRALLLTQRAKKLYLRAKGYGVRALEARHPGFTAAAKGELDPVLAQATKEDVPFLYWTAAAWALAIAAGKDQPEILADFPQVEKLARAALAQDPTWSEGTLHEFFITFEAASPTGDRKKAREHFEQAIALSKGAKAGPYVSLAENVSVKEQNLKEFKELLGKALAIDVEAHPEYRLVNTVMQRRAQRLLGDVEDLFLESEGTDG